MSLIRSFTTRRGKVDELSNPHIGRAASQRAGKPIQRSQISSPVALISTTNSLSYEAPDIVGIKPTRQVNRNISFGSSAASSHSAEDSDTSTLSINSNTDASSVDDASSPITPEAEPNHLSCYFKPAVDTRSGNQSPSESTRTSLDAPVIPQRVPSHSKRAHEHIHRKRSVQRMISPTSSIVKRTSADMFKQPTTPTENPFGNELAQLDEVAEELSQTVRDAEADADAVHMEVNGLACFDASDYLGEIHTLIYDVYLADEPSWI